MVTGAKKQFEYTIWDPTGNMTALAEGQVSSDRRPAAAEVLMRRHPEVEQVGFVEFPESAEIRQRFPESTEGGQRIRAVLGMAGGEFCGNASMCAAALSVYRRDPEWAEHKVSEEDIFLIVSGAARPVRTKVKRISATDFRTRVYMPPALAFEDTEFVFEDLSGTLPVIRMEGISHILIEPDSVFFRLLKDRPAAGRAVRTFCRRLSAEGLGLMFLRRDTSLPELFPLVYIPGSETEFWENSCASGTSAVGMYLASRSGRAVKLSLSEPGGTLEVESRPESGETVLAGHAAFRARFAASYVD